MADFNTTVAQAIDLLDAGNISAAGAELYGDQLGDGGRSFNAIIETATEVGLRIFSAIATSPVSGRRGQLITDFVTTQNSGDTLPNHVGDYSTVKIMPYSGAPFVIGHHKSREEILAYLNDATINFYDPIAHNLAGSSLTAYWDIVDERIYFTGYQASVELFNVSKPAVTGGFIQSLSPNALGSGYTSTATVTISAPQNTAGRRATAIPIIRSSDGAITGYQMTDLGTGYTSDTAITATVAPGTGGGSGATIIVNAVNTVAGLTTGLSQIPDDLQLLWVVGTVANQFKPGDPVGFFANYQQQWQLGLERLAKGEL